MTSTPSRIASMATSRPSSPAPSRRSRVASSDPGVPIFTCRFYSPDRGVLGVRSSKPKERIDVMEVLYRTEATAWGGRDGRAATSDGRLDVQLVSPPELGGAPDGQGTNPEQLFAAGYAGCFHNALKLVARRKKVDVSESAITVRVGLGMVETGFGL